MTIGTERNRIGHRIRSSFHQLTHIMQLEVRQSVNSIEGGRAFAAFAPSRSLLQDPSLDAGILRKPGDRHPPSCRDDIAIRLGEVFLPDALPDRNFERN